MTITITITLFRIPKNQLATWKLNWAVGFNLGFGCFFFTAAACRGGDVNVVRFVGGGLIPASLHAACCMLHT
jgi:hypothetical protein